MSGLPKNFRELRRFFAATQAELYTPSGLGIQIDVTELTHTNLLKELRPRNRDTQHWRLKSL
ncbi:hypothetical protein A6770_00760 [Nostoc minutum NIES-26]|uniref:Uncharacterized protein n=1 Tax=Nostoc minutum NIES-26 TaxID=1844469 RepID=A0A367QYD1_9NOSO|nr:hypothetical protein A6770_00760 [Nostoc minutum NIES-26]